MSKVFVRSASYDYETLKPVVFEIMDGALGEDGIKAGSLVVIKPNLLAPAPPERAVITHPLLIRAAAQYALEKGARVRVSDSPAIGSFEKILREGGITEALRGLDVECRAFGESVEVQAGEPFKKIELSGDALDADVLINLPKLKTHAQMLLTLGVKNLFGCVVGLRKPQWHLRAGTDRQMFARLLVQIYAILKPSVTIIDGIIAMEGQGPGSSGTPRHLGVILGGQNALALDRAVCRMLGVEPRALPTIRAAEEMGLSEGEPEIDGGLPRVTDFRLPVLGEVIFGPKALHGVMRAHLTRRPEADERLCLMCGECLKYCPAQAISKIAPKKKKGKKDRLEFDYERCIRCYCCLEVCPHGALRAKESLAAKVVGRLMRRDLS